MNVTIANYVQHALKTNQREYEPLWERLGISSPQDEAERVLLMDLYHGSVGLATEAGEILDWHKKSVFYAAPDKINIGEEIGDCFWYIAIMLNAGGWNLADMLVKTEVVESYKRGLCFNAAELVGQIYRLAGECVITATVGLRMGTLSWFALQPNVERVIGALWALLATLDIALNTALEANITKLTQKRYKSGVFNAAEAVQRDVALERQSLEESLG